MLALFQLHLRLVERERKKNESMAIIEKTRCGFQKQLDPGAQVLLSEISSCPSPAFLCASLILRHSVSLWWQMLSRSYSCTPYQLSIPYRNGVTCSYYFQQKSQRFLNSATVEEELNR